MLGVKTVIIR